MIRFKKIEHDSRDFFPELIKIFGQDKDIAAVYLFGSYATGGIGPLSDVDLAVLLVKEFQQDKYFGRKLDVISKASSALRTDELDVVVLNEAPVDLRYSVISKGILLVEREVHRRVGFETSTLNTSADGLKKGE